MTGELRRVGCQLALGLILTPSIPVLPFVCWYGL